VKSLRHILGLSCEGFEDELMALFTAIEASRHQNDPASSPSSLSKLVNRGHHELKRLACSIMTLREVILAKVKVRRGIQHVLNEA
jgi:hypothetical protein